MNNWKVIFETNLPFKLFGRGKVRDTWELPDGNLLIVATDRISAFDVVIGAIPGKGKILTKMSEFWFDFIRDLTIDHHLLAMGVPTPYCRDGRDWTGIDMLDLMERTMVVKKADVVLPVECVVRGFLAGSGWAEYRENRVVCGNELPPGLQEGSMLVTPIFTPATKAAAGFHDDNITYNTMVDAIKLFLMRQGVVRPSLASARARDLAEQMRTASLRIYRKASAYAQSRGIIIADTKFEFGLKDDKLLLIDELLTPDSSRFWPVEDWEPGKSQKSFDKQYLRDWLISIGWDKKPPAPNLSEEVVKVTAEKYQEADRRLLP